MPVAKELKVLIVDDQASMRQLTRMTLRQLGFQQITEAESGREALMEHLRNNRFDLIISDLHMKDGDGLVLLKAVRKHPLLKDIPFIVLSGNREVDLARKVVEAGCNGYVVKPFSMGILKSRIEAAIGKLL